MSTEIQPHLHLGFQFDLLYIRMLVDSIERYNVLHAIIYSFSRQTDSIKYEL